MATKMMLRSSKNNVPLQLLRLMKPKSTVVKSFPTIVDSSVFCGGSWNVARKDEMKDGDFIREMRNASLEILKGKSIGVEMRGGRPMVSDEEDDYEDKDDVDSEDFDDCDDDDDDDDDDSDEDDEEEKDVRKPRK